jgi:ubiquinone/menaquinone biosynthesis C-methylase UbiE
MADDVFEYDGYQIPIGLLNLTGGGPDQFHVISQYHIAALQEVAPLRPEMNILEIGCGIGRDAIPLTKILSKNGSYLGIDISQESITWDSENITARFPNFRFICHDIKEPWYNPNGKLSLRDCSIPLPENSVDLVILQSVLTHMLRDNISLYLKEFSRVIRDDGHIYATVFLVDDFILHSQDFQAFISFNHYIGDGCYVNDLSHPTKVVAYKIGAIEAMAREAGLELAAPLPVPKSWSAFSGQDRVVLRRAATHL